MALAPRQNPTDSGVGIHLVLQSAHKQKGLRRVAAPEINVVVGFHSHEMTTQRLRSDDVPQLVKMLSFDVRKEVGYHFGIGDPEPVPFRTGRRSLVHTT